jgi:hypothetical protein
MSTTIAKPNFSSNECTKNNKNGFQHIWFVKFNKLCGMDQNNSCGWYIVIVILIQCFIILQSCNLFIKSWSFAYTKCNGMQYSHNYRNLDYAMWPNL